MTVYINGFIGGSGDELLVGSDKRVVQVGENCGVSAFVRDNNGNPVTGQIVHFFEKYTPTINVSSDKQIIQSGDTAVLSAKVKDEDGSLVVGQKVHFFVKED